MDAVPTTAFLDALGAATRLRDIRRVTRGRGVSLLDPPDAQVATLATSLLRNAQDAGATPQESAAFNAKARTLLAGITWMPAPAQYQLDHVNRRALTA